MVRKVAAVFAGFVVVLVVVAGLQMVGSSFHPTPEGLDPADPGQRDAFAEHLAGMPAISWAIAFGSELLGGLLGGLTAGWIARDSARIFSGAIVGLTLMGSVSNWLAFPHPTWFIVGQLVGYPLVLVVIWAILRRAGGGEAAA